MECNINKNKSNCICTYEPCSRKGKCCECIQYHVRNEELPACAFSKEVERTYDRSFARFAKAVQSGE